MAKRTSRRRGRHERPVEFRGLSTHYVLGGDIEVTFRYPVSSFHPQQGDLVKMYRRGARHGERSIASVSVEDVTKHRLCDGGLYKSGTVTIPTTALAISNETEAYVLLYGSSSRRKVVGKSQPFIICPQREYPSMRIRGSEDNIFIEKMRAYSPFNEQPMFPKGIGQEDEVSKEMSFVMVSDNDHLLEEWESLDKEKEIKGKEDKLGSWEDCGRKLVYKRSQSYESSDSNSSEEHLLLHNESSESDSSEEANLLPKSSDEPKVGPHGDEGATQRSQVKQTEMGNGLAVPKPTIQSGMPTHDHSGERESTAEVHVRTASNSSSMNGDDGLHAKALLRKGKPKDACLDDDTFMKDIDISESTVIVEDLSPSQVLMIKNANKELRAKVRILHNKLQMVNRERASEKLEEELSQLKQEKSELKQRSRKLCEEMSALKEKVKQLEHEVSTLSQHCKKQVCKIGQYETQLKLVNSKAEESQKKVHYLEKQCQNMESQLRHKQDCQRGKPGSSTTVVKKSAQEEREKMRKLCEVPEIKNTVAQHNKAPRRPVIEVSTKEERRGEKEEVQIEEMEKKQLVIKEKKQKIQPAARKTATSDDKAAKEGDKATEGAGVLTEQTSLSDEHIASIMTRLKGGQPTYECPICCQQLYSHETEFSARLHVEQCLLKKN